MPHVESAAASDGPPPQDAWHAEFQRLVPLWESLRETSKVIIPISISRVNQFDAARLDVEMSAMLKEQLVKVFSLMKDSYSNMSLSSMLSSNSSSGGSQFGLTSQPQAMH